MSDGQAYVIGIGIAIGTLAIMSALGRIGDVLYRIAKALEERKP